MGFVTGRPAARTYWVLVLIGVIGGAITLVAKSTPTFDPWSWIVWGREILHGHLSLLYGPSWKPLPVLFTTVFAVFGSLAPNLWLLVAHAGLIVTALMLIRLGARVTWRFSDRMQYTPALLAGLLAAGTYTLGPHVLFDSALGNSEGVLTAAVLVAVELAVDGRHRAAFVVGIVPALDRPESWAFWVPYGLWLMWRDRGARVLVLTLFAAVVLLWFVPQRLGSGSFTSSVTRAQNLQPHRVSGASCPFCRDLGRVAWPLVPARIRYVAVASIVIGLMTLGLVIRSGRRPLSAGRREQVLMLWGALGAAGFVWWMLIALESEFGFSGSSRYMMLGTVLVYLAGAIGYGLAATLAAEWLARSTGPPLSRPPVASALATLVAVIAFALIPGWMISHHVLRSPLGVLKRVNYQGTLRTDLESVIARAGGIRRLDCGQVLAEFYQGPMVAWYFNRSISEIAVEQSAANKTGRGRQVAPGAWPRVVIQDAPTLVFGVQPKQGTISGWERLAGHPYRVFAGKQLKLYTDCGLG